MKKLMKTVQVLYSNGLTGCGGGGSNTGTAQDDHDDDRHGYVDSKLIR